MATFALAAYQRRWAKRDGNAGQLGFLTCWSRGEAGRAASRPPASVLAWRGPARACGPDLLQPDFRLASAAPATVGLIDVWTEGCGSCRMPVLAAWRHPPAPAPALIASRACRPRRCPRRSAPIPGASVVRGRLRGTGPGTWSPGGPVRAGRRRGRPDQVSTATSAAAVHAGTAVSVNCPPPVHISSPRALPGLPFAGAWRPNPPGRF
jgi:hypothetical protein